MDTFSAGKTLYCSSFQSYEGNSEKVVNLVYDTTQNNETTEQFAIFKECWHDIVINIGNAEKEFYVACADAGSERSVIGKKEPIAHFECIRQTLESIQSLSSIAYKFRNQQRASIRIH